MQNKTPRNSKQLCSYCGVNPATTKDHIPPKTIFTKPRPHDLITVPACFTCNNAASILDEKFMVYLGMHVARQRGGAERLFKESVLRAVSHNGTLRRKILKEIEPVELVTKAGIITGKAHSVLWDSEAHDAVIERIIRGLFFHHYNTVLPKQVKIDLFWFEQLPDIDVSNLYVETIANGAFTYAFNKVDDCDFASIWIFQFYKGHWAGGMIMDDNLIEDLEQ